jgi:hypothetical protein
MSQIGGAGGTELATDCRLRGGVRAVTWACVGVAALPHGANGAPGFVVTLTDVTDHKEAERDHEVRLAIEEETGRGLSGWPWPRHLPSCTAGGSR